MSAAISEKQPALVQGDSATGAPIAITASEMKALERFLEVCEDGEGYDVPKTMMRRLASLGLLNHISGGIYELTLFGDYVSSTAQVTAPTSQVVTVCVWQLPDMEYEIWDSACGESWTFNEGGPLENRVNFCQGCGCKVEIAAPTPKDPT